MNERTEKNKDVYEWKHEQKALAIATLLRLRAHLMTHLNYANESCDAMNCRQQIFDCEAPSGDRANSTRQLSTRCPFSNLIDTWLSKAERWDNRAKWFRMWRKRRWRNVQAINSSLRWANPFKLRRKQLLINYEIAPGTEILIVSAREIAIRFNEERTQEFSMFKICLIRGSDYSDLWTSISRSRSSLPFQFIHFFEKPREEK